MKRTWELRDSKGTVGRGAAYLLTMTMFIGLFTGIPVKQAQAAALSNPRRDIDGTVTYDCVYFGNYWQEDTNGDGKANKQDAKTPIKWRVLSVNGNDAFLIADKNLDMQRYNTSFTSVIWETCTMRSWLNGYGSNSNSDGTDYTDAGKSFVSNAFTDSERNAIKNTTLDNADNQFYGTSGGNETTDKVFLLSLEDISNTAYGFSNYGLIDGNGKPIPIVEMKWDEEAKKYEKTINPLEKIVKDENGSLVERLHYGESYKDKVYDYAKLRYNTDFAKGSDTASGKSYTYSIGTGYWWLRSPGCDHNNAAYVFRNGYVYQHGDYVDYCHIIGVCPALHLDLSSSDVWSYAGTVEIKKAHVAVDNIDIKGNSQKIAAGKEITLSPVFTPSNCSNKALKWKSSNTRYATVSDKGVVTTKKQGAGKTVTITATAQDGSNVKAEYKIKLVKDAVKNVKLAAKTKSVKAGSKISVKAIVKTTGKTANKTLLWTSSNKSYATVTKKGVVKTKKAGKGKTVKITAKAVDGTGKKATIKIKIK